LCVCVIFKIQPVHTDEPTPYSFVTCMSVLIVCYLYCTSY
jgi:hypothetical protein